MAEASKKMKEEADLTNEILYGKKNSKKSTEQSEKKVNSPTVEDLKDEDEDLQLEILTGKKVKPAKITNLSKEDQEDVEMVTELLGNTKKKKAESKESDKSEKKPGKKFNREDYFGL